MSVRKSDYKPFSFKCPKVGQVGIQAKLDIGAQSLVPQGMPGCWFHKGRSDSSDIFFVCGKQVLYLDSWCHIRATGWCFPGGSKMSCATMVYVSPSAEGFF